MEDDKLTIKQERYAQGLFAGLSQREAYKRAYNASNMKDSTIDRNACELAGDNKISTRIEYLTNEFKERNMLTVEWVLNNLKYVTERCLQQQAVLDREGNNTGEYKFEHTGANKSLELIGKHLGMFTDRIESHNITETIEYTAEDRQKRIAELQDKLGYKKIILNNPHICVDI